MRSNAITLAIVLALHAAPGVAADDAPLEELIVTARRILTPGLGAESLDATDVARRRARTSDTASLLTGIPGVAARGAGGVSSLPIVRGLADDRLRTQVDGTDIAAACPNHMNPPLSYIDPTAVAAVDVYAGVTPVSLGGDSIGGTILVRSADPEFAQAGAPRLKGEAGTFFRSIGDSWGGNLAGSYATEHLSLGYTGAFANADNYTAGDDFKDYTFTGRAGHTLPTDEVGSTAYESSNHTVRLAWRSRAHLLDFSYSYQDIPEQGFANQRMDMTGNTASKFNLVYTSRPEWGTLQARGYYQETEHEMDFGPDKRFWYGAASGGMGMDGSPCSPISATCAAGMPMKADGNTTGLTVNAAIKLAEQGLVRVGGEYLGFRLDDWWPPSGSGMWPYAFLNINDGERDRYAAYGEWEVRHGRWSHIAGVRYEHVATDAGPVHGYDSSTFPTGGTGGTGGMGNQTRDAALFNAQSRDKSDDNLDVSWIGSFTPAETQRYEFQLAQKTRSPNLYERYTWSTWQMSAFMNNVVGDGNGYFGDADLKPEVARTVSATADWHDTDSEFWSVRITPYYTKVEDYIDALQWDATSNVPRAVPVVDDFTVLRHVNQDATLYGVDFSAASRLGSSDRLGVFSAGLVGSYTRGENDDTDDNLYGIMPLNATLSLTQELGRWRNMIEGEFVSAKDDVSQVRNEMPTAGYGLVHLRARYEHERWSAELGVENLFDRYYEHPLGGAYVGQGSTMMNPMPPNQPRWGTPVPGPGRSLYAAVNLQF
jgi:iron complex outermembrane receptor protein